ncbi:MAG TPA: Bax inhibitor-1/YccA family protein [Chitinophagaceae bacterium]
MSIFKSGNPTLSEKIFTRSLNAEQEMNGTMSVRGTINKFGFMLIMVLAGATYTWYLYENSVNQLNVIPYLWGGLIGGFITALIIIFKPAWSPYLAPAYGILEGLFLGAISVIVNDAFRESHPGIVMQAVGLTFCVAIVMFLLYNFRIIRPTQKFKAILLVATASIALFYLVLWVMRIFGAYPGFMELGDNSLLGYGISFFIVAIAALNLILDFERIETGADMGAPRYMEWYCAFGLMVTIVWLYIEILRLLSRFNSRN